MLILSTSFLLYAFFSLWMVHSIYNEMHTNLHVLLAGLFLLTGFLFCVHVVKEGKRISRALKTHTLYLTKEDAHILLAVVAGASITFLLNHSADIDAVLASSMIGLASAWTIRKYSVPIYCGTFIGMACNQIFSNPLYIGLASLISGILFVISRHVFDGWGGRAGFIAFVGTYFTSLLIGEPLRVVEPLNTRMYIYVFVFAMIACLSTFAIQSMEQMDAVSASALIGLTMAILYPEASHVIVLSAFCGSFAGMTSKDHFTHKSDIVIASLLTAFLFVIAFSMFDGAGGKLGALAFLATGATSGLKDCIAFIRYYLPSLPQNFYKSNNRKTKTGQG